MRANKKHQHRLPSRPYPEYHDRRSLWSALSQGSLHSYINGSFMSKIQQVLAVLALSLVALVGVDQDSRAAHDTNPAQVEMQQTLRELWLGHIFAVQHVILYNLAKDPAEQDAAEKAVVANAKQIANTFAPFYGEAQAEKLFTLLTGHYAAVKEYSKAIIAGNKGQVNAALVQFESNTDGIDLFFSGVNPNYLPKGTVRPLIAVHVSHHILRINLYHKKEYAKLDATWPMMRQHVYLIADTLTRALAKQFPDKFS